MIDFVFVIIIGFIITSITVFMACMAFWNPFFAPKDKEEYLIARLLIILTVSYIILVGLFFTNKDTVVFKQKYKVYNIDGVNLVIDNNSTVKQLHFTPKKSTVIKSKITDRWWLFYIESVEWSNE